MYFLQIKCLLISDKIEYCAISMDYFTFCSFLLIFFFIFVA